MKTILVYQSLLQYVSSILDLSELIYILLYFREAVIFPYVILCKKACYHHQYLIATMNQHNLKTCPTYHINPFRTYFSVDFCRYEVFIQHTLHLPESVPLKGEG